MADDKFAFQIDPDKSFQKLISNVAEQTGNLTIPFVMMTKDWFKGNRALADIAGKGKYTDLTPAYKKAKMKATGQSTPYPVLFRSGALIGSLTLPNSPDSISQIVNKTILILGTKDRTALWHQTGAGRLPVRPMVFLGPEQTAPDGINRRREAWIKIMEDYLNQVMERQSK